MVEINIPGTAGGKMPNPKSVAGLVTVIVVIFVGLSALGTVFYSVEPEEVGVIQRFGKYVRTTQPGLRTKLPWGIEKLTRVKKERIFTEEFGFRTKKAGINTTYYTAQEAARFSSLANDSYSRKLGFRKDPFLVESLILTGDLNAADVEWAVLYKVKDPVQFLFNVKNVRSAIRDISEAVMRQVVGDVTVDEILTTGKVEIQERAKQMLQELLDEYGAGIEIRELVLQDVNPPIEVKDSFNEVNEALQDKERIINQARADYNRVIPKATGQAQKKVSEAEGYALNRINQAKGEAERFMATWNAYKSAKDVTKRRMYLETMIDILPQVHKKVVLDSDTKGVLPFYNLTAEEGKGGVL